MKTITISGTMILMLLWTTSCGTFRPTYSETSPASRDSIFETIRAGDRLRLELKDGRTVTGAFQVLNDREISMLMSTNASQIKQRQSVPLSYVVAIEKWESKPGETAAVVGLSVLLIGVLVFGATFQLRLH